MLVYVTFDLYKSPRSCEIQTRGGPQFVGGRESTCKNLNRIYLELILCDCGLSTSE